jgi:hypothetical protein
MLRAFHEMGMLPAAGGAPVRLFDKQGPVRPRFEPAVTGVFICVGLRQLSAQFLDIQRRELVRQQQDWDDHLRAIVKSGQKLMSQATDGTMVETIVGPDGKLISADPNKKLIEIDRTPTLVFPGGEMLRSTPFPNQPEP